MSIVNATFHMEGMEIRLSMYMERSAAKAEEEVTMMKDYIQKLAEGDARDGPRRAAAGDDPGRRRALSRNGDDEAKRLRPGTKDSAN